MEPSKPAKQDGNNTTTLASNPGFPFRILSRSFGEKSIFLQSCETKSNGKPGFEATTTHFHHPYILCHFANDALCLLVVCIGGLWKAVGR